MTRLQLKPPVVQSVFSASVTAPGSITTPLITAPARSGTEPTPCTVTDGCVPVAPKARIAARTEVAPMSSPMACPSRFTGWTRVRVERRRPIM